MFTSIAGRSVVITEDDKGIGRGIAEVFADAGAKVLIAGRDESALTQAVDELGAAGGEVSAVTADISDREQCNEMAATAVSRYGGIDILCANAGIFPSARLDIDDDLETVLATNFKGTVFAGRAYLRGARRVGPGPDRRDLVDHRAVHRLPRLVALRGQQGGPARVHPDRSHGAGAAERSPSTRCCPATSSPRG